MDVNAGKLNKRVEIVRISTSTSARMQVLYWGRRAEPASGSATPAPSM